MKTCAISILALAVASLQAFPANRLAIVISPDAGNEWREVAATLAAKHSGDAVCSIMETAPTGSLEKLREFSPTHVAFVMPCDSFDNSVLLALKSMMRCIDPDPYDDAIWSVLTGPVPSVARRIAASREPQRIDAMLATTGVDMNDVPGEVAVLSDAFPVGEYMLKSADGSVVKECVTGDVSHVFREAWARLDPQLIVTSSHATERNLEMPFSQGNVTVANGAFVAGGATFSVPRREKVWIAPGNCLIANHIDSNDMLMTALSFGKVNQFAGYIKKTWFGFVGWNTWRNFEKLGMPLNEAYFSACRELQRKLSSGEWDDDREKAGLEWDLDGTMFYGDPLLEIRLAPAQ